MSFDSFIGSSTVCRRFGLSFCDHFAKDLVRIFTRFSLYCPYRSEHERHAIQCPYIRGEYTDNVPLEETQASCPAHRCSLRREGQQGAGPGAQDRIVVLGTSMGTELVAVGTEWGRVVLLDMGGGLLITVSYN